MPRVSGNGGAKGGVSWVVDYIKRNRVRREPGA